MPRVGARIKENYFNNSGGVNNADSPFIVPPNQGARNSRNYEYDQTGGIKKRLGLIKVNSVADTQLDTVGMAARITKSGVDQTIRAAGTKLQNVSLLAGSFTNLTEDTSTAGTDFLTSGTTQPVAQSMFSTSSTDILWLAGGGMSSINGVYSDSKVTANGVDAPAGSIGTSVGAGGGSFVSTGTYFYGVALKKASTGAISNVALDASAAVSATTDRVTIDLSTITAFDQTKYDQIYIYRSAVGGVTNFTTGDLIAQVASSSTSYIDDGTSITSSINIARAGNTVLDNSTLPAGTYKFVTLFKRRLVTVKDNTVYISDLNKPESWPLHNRFDLPSGEEVTALGIISFNSATTSDVDEFLCIFKENELRILTGSGTVDADGVADWELKFISEDGCNSNKSLVSASGFLAWVNRRGLFMWDGISKPIYASRLIERFFAFDGDLDLSKLDIVWGVFFRKQNQMVWCFSHKTFGAQKYFLKLDLRLTLPNITGDLGGRVLNAVFIPDTYDTTMRAAVAYKPDAFAEEQMVIGDDAGFIYRAYTITSDDSASIDFNYETPYLDQGSPGIEKDYHSVIVWVENVGDWDLTLRYWSNYRVADADSSAIARPIGATTNSSQALWDVAFWDEALWDDFTTQPKALLFNLSPSKNNSTGDALKLRFEQTNANEPVTILGYSVIYSAKASIKK